MEAPDQWSRSHLDQWPHSFDRLQYCWGSSCNLLTVFPDQLDGHWPDLGGQQPCHLPCDPGESKNSRFIITTRNEGIHNSGEIYFFYSPIRDISIPIVASILVSHLLLRFASLTTQKKWGRKLRLTHCLIH